MATNKNALIRYKTIDKCLRDTTRLWTLDDLIAACTEALCEYEGKENVVSKRTIQLDIQNMRSDKIGYNAPIEVFDNKYYRYADSDYSITKTEIPYEDIKKMRVQGFFFLPTDEWGAASLGGCCFPHPIPPSSDTLG